MVSLFYKMNNNDNLFKDFENIGIMDTQNFNPLYNKFFKLDENNFNGINLNSYYNLERIHNKLGSNKYKCVIRSKNNIQKNETFFKLSPLLDPVKYIAGKYKKLDENTIRGLPKLNNNTYHKKIRDANNSAYVDSFFSYLTSQLLHHHKFVNGIDFYGSFLAVKNDFKCDIYDDLDYLNDNSHFHKNKNVIFKVASNFDELVDNSDSRNYKKKIQIGPNHIGSVGYRTLEGGSTNAGGEILLIDGVEGMDKLKNKPDNTSRTSRHTGSTCSSRTSNTSNTETDDVETDDAETDDVETDDAETDDVETDDAETDNSSDDDMSRCSNSSCGSSCSGCSTISETPCDVVLNNFPVNVISLELMENTLDSILSKGMSVERWASCLFQIIITLISYQKAFSFTHNDLHTNNIMYNTTDLKFISYKYNNKYYKVPTYGKIFKIIDFGRAIYKFKNKVMCSDSFHKKGDASTQYNFEPYMNRSKPTLEPNYSFDLCRLGCSLYDYFNDEDKDEDEGKLENPIKTLINKWCTDDKNRNIIYKNCGEERYPEFKLYKMIVRTVHNHLPENYIDDDIFKSFITSKKHINKKKLVNIDKLITLDDN
jgi:hypothetical protein